MKILMLALMVVGLVLIGTGLHLASSVPHKEVWGMEGFFPVLIGTGVIAVAAHRLSRRHF